MAVKTGIDMTEQPDLCGPWRFQPDLAGEGVSRGWFRPEYDTRHWRDVNVPISFDDCMPILDSYEGDGWFRRSFAVPAEWRGRRVALRFAGVNYHASVWVNGTHVGDHHDGFLPFEFAIHDVLQWGEQNVVVIRADNVRRKGEVPGIQRGWRPFGGILREVELIATDMVHVGDVAVVAEPMTDGGGGTISIKVAVVNDGAHGAAVTLAVHCVRDGVRLCEITAGPQSCAAGQSVSLQLGGSVPRVLPWSPDEPNLYDLHVELRAEGRVVEHRTVRVGFRRIEVRATRLYLNGKPIFLMGFNRHEDSPRTGMCRDMPTTRQDLLDMKAAGANFIRLCHYPHHPGELDMCDELGLLAMGEIPLFWWDGLAEGDDNCARKLEAARRQLTAMIRRDFNHASIIFWSVSNETHEQRPEVVEGNAELLQFARSLDPTRLVTHASNHWRDGQAARLERQFEADLAIGHAGGSDTATAGGDVQFEHDDVICVNAYPSLNQRGFGGAHDYDFARSTQYWRDELAKLHARYPGKPIMVSEFGYASLADISDTGFSEDAQADAIAHEFAGMDAPYVCGAAVWCWADHPWPQTGFCRNMRTSPYGVLTRDRHKLRAYQTIQKLFHDKHHARLSKA